MDTPLYTMRAIHSTKHLLSRLSSPLRTERGKKTSVQQNHLYLFPIRIFFPGRGKGRE